MLKLNRVLFERVCVHYTFPKCIYSSMTQYHPPSQSIAQSMLPMTLPSSIDLSINEPIQQPLEIEMKKGKRTYQPSCRRRKRKFGFLRRLSTSNGKKVINRRKNKGRKYIAV